MGIEVTKDENHVVCWDFGDCRFKGVVEIVVLGQGAAEGRSIGTDDGKACFRGDEAGTNEAG